MDDPGGPNDWLKVLIKVRQDSQSERKRERRSIMEAELDVMCNFLDKLRSKY